MKTKNPTYVRPTLSSGYGRKIAFATSIVAMGIGLLNAPALHGATLLWKGPNAAVYFGLPFNSLEFENPLSGAEMVLSHKVLDWQDADYAAGPPPWYDDWTVSHPGEIDGNANEIWLRQQGHSAQTTTTVPSRIVSIHLNSDDNDGLADVIVDGVTVAQLDMFTPACCQTVLIIVTGLSNTTHTVTVNDVGPGQGRGDDVHIMGAAALAESEIKWGQAPLPATPDNVYYGWNQQSMEYLGPIAADDWVCTNNLPVTKIRWWGSFLGWNHPDPPYQIPAFKIRFWTDVPAGVDPQFPFSHPGRQLGETIYCNTYTMQWVGWDYDPRSGTYEACFMYEQTLPPDQWFYQTNGPTGTNIYWISIEAVVLEPLHLWGWKTRPRDPSSPAPDDAVVFDPFMPWYAPLWWPSEKDSWDLAFELITQEEVATAKWLQVPDLSPQGMDVHASYNPMAPPPYLLADDFLCTSPGPITNITIWGSWSNDVYWPYTVFTLSIHEDIPASQSPTGYSMPGRLLWLRTFQPGGYNWSVYAEPINEWWFTPANWATFPGDHVCFQYNFNIPEDLAFRQEGTPERPIVYWLDVQADTTSEIRPPPLFGWKTCPTNWNDDAVWVNAREPYSGNWNKLTYPTGHPRQGQTVDLAFRINQSTQLGQEIIKWSQPPMPYIPPDGYNGWNQLSVGGQQIAADDWVCTNANPVTDIHWWGSFIGWGFPGIPEQPAPTLPDGFLITIWSDVPQGPNDPFSHPGEALWEMYCTNFTWEFVGWDFDPRNPGAPPEACFKWHQDLLPEEYFYQDPANGTNIYWVSIVAVYASGQQIQYPWGWKTRLRDPTSPAPDDAVYSDPSSPVGWLPIEYPPGVSWDLAFELTTKEVLIPTNDFGDAPSPYPTLLANDGARHAVTPGVFLGNLIDAEMDGLPDPLAKGDDLNNLADEDGVGLLTPLVPGELAHIQVTASVAGFVSAWVDFGADGSWAEPGDQIANNVPVTSGLNTISFNVPTNAARGTYTFARVRFARVAITNYTGWLPNGEVEDYRWYIEELDFGDAPDPTFPTLRASNGARHVVTVTPAGAGIFMGAQIDSEPDGQPDATATGDDLANLADEDGVTLLTPLLPGQPAAVQVVASIANGVLNAWIDFDADGTWAQPGDQIANNVVLPVAGPNIVTFTVPPTAAAGSNVFARFRFSTMGGLSFTGIAPNGEVEDYLWHIEQLDLGDAPDPTYPTYLVNNGASHIIGPLYLGAGVDAETDGQPNASATGDDLAGIDDEDGVFFPTALIANAPATIQVVSSGTGLLQGWFDFNSDGDWADVGEQAIVNQPVAAGTNLIQIFVPNAVSGQSYARFRLSTLTNLTFTGQAPDGEVEDYGITFQPLKWSMPPEQGPEGVNVNDLILLADDFMCYQSGPITDIHIWGSFLNDVLPAHGPGYMIVTLQIYSDMPMGPGGYSQPGMLLWSRTFAPGQFNAGLAMMGASEWWHDPAAQPPPPLWIPNADTNIWQLDFYIDPTNAFVQVSNTVYWLAVQYRPVPGDTNFNFGWKTTYRRFNDAACWYDPATGMWVPLIYGDGHPRARLEPPWNWIDFAFALSTTELDWGDAPDAAAAPGYPTLAAHNGAAHVIVPGLTLGSLIDSEADGQPDATATGDDNANLDDEDGVILPVLVPGQPDTVSVTVNGSGLLSAWIDFGADGSWAEAGDQILADVPLSTGTYLLNFNVPSNAVWGATTFARFRFSTASGLGYTGIAPDGEVEDHLVYIHPLPQPDLGDAPDSSNNIGPNMTAYPKGGPPGILANYPTVYAGPIPGPPWGPIHWNPTGVAILGAAVSGEMDADIGPDQDFINNILPATDTPDLDGADDGLVGLPILPHCGLGLINVQFSWPGLPPWPQMWLNVWCDWNRDGDWNDILICPDGTRVPEWAGQNIPVPAGAAALPVPILCWHPSLKKDPIWIRITLAEQMWPAPGGGLIGGDGPQLGYQFGETEDYYITDYDDQQTFDFGDAPAPYLTMLPNGARHLIVPNFMLGRRIDAEPDGQPDPLALGDDNNNLPDEDGVTFTTPVLVGTQACVNVFLTGPIGGFLDAWIDFDKNGSWDPTDQIFASQPLVNGLNPGLCFNVPTNAVLCTNFARFRLSSAGSLTPVGPAQDGEVEDYLVVIRQRAPLTNIIITNIVVTNITISGNVSNVVKLQWNAEAGVHYQVWALNTFSNTPPFLWTNVGPIIIGPANTFVETNAVRLERYYRVVAPCVWP